MLATLRLLHNEKKIDACSDAIGIHLRAAAGASRRLILVKVLKTLHMILQDGWLQHLAKGQRHWWTDWGDKNGPQTRNSIALCCAWVLIKPNDVLCNHWAHLRKYWRTLVYVLTAGNGSESPQYKGRTMDACEGTLQAEAAASSLLSELDNWCKPKTRKSAVFLTTLKICTASSACSASSTCTTSSTCTASSIWVTELHGAGARLSNKLQGAESGQMKDLRPAAKDTHIHKKCLPKWPQNGPKRSKRAEMTEKAMHNFIKVLKNTQKGMHLHLFWKYSLISAEISNKKKHTFA